MEGFAGIPQAGLDFLRHLAENNNREWFEAHKDVYRESVETPALELVAALGTCLQSTISEEIIFDTRRNGSGSLMRIYRDTRFSRDKTPYKSKIAMMFWQSAGKKTESPAFGLQFDADDAELMAGIFQFPKPMLAAYREAVLDDALGSELRKAINAVRQAGDYEIGGESYKRVPRGLPADHERADLLRHAGLYAYGPTLSAADLTSPELVTLCCDHFQKLAPVQRWLVKI